MATNTYVALQAQTLSANASSVTLSSIPQTYTDLVLVISAKNTTGQNYETFLRFENDSGGNYSQTFMQNYTDSSQAGRNLNISEIRVGKTNSSTFDINIININNYSSTSKHKTTLSRSNNANFASGALVGLWRDTRAITRIDAICESGSVYTAGSTFTLYGIANSNIGAPKAFGGTITQDANYTYHTFGASGTFTPQQSLTCDWLVIAGGGSAGSTVAGTPAGGGGAGGMRSSVTGTGGGGSVEGPITVTATSYAITVGAGGAQVTSTNNGNQGSNSTFSSITSVGGGYGGKDATNGGAGGSGGGASILSTGGAGTANQGFAGGNGGLASGYQPTGGGGGAGQAGYSATGSSTVAGAGGNGVANDISGASVTYAGGGGGGTGNGIGGTPGAGGSGGGGAGVNGGNGVSGTVNTGGGGGAAGGLNGIQYIGGAGGSGIVIIRYAN